MCEESARPALRRGELASDRREKMKVADWMNVDVDVITPIFRGCP